MPAFSSKNRHRIELKAADYPEVLEADAWIEIRTRPSARMVLEISAAGNDYERAAAFLRTAILGWSWPEPATPENLDDLDVALLVRLLDEAQRIIPLEALSTPGSRETT